MASTAAPSAVDEDAARVVREVPMVGRAHRARAADTDFEGAAASLCPATASSPGCTHRGTAAISPRTRDNVLRGGVSRNAGRRHVAALGNSYQVDLELGPPGCRRSVDPGPRPQEIRDLGGTAPPRDGPGTHRRGFSGEGQYPATRRSADYSSQSSRRRARGPIS